MKTNSEKILTLSTLVVLVAAAALIMNLSSAAPQANAVCNIGPACGKVVDINPSTKNPHPDDEPQGNPHQFESGCSGNPHGQINLYGSSECPGAQ